MARPRDPEITKVVLDTTMELLAERGFAALSMAAIAARAGVGKPAIYRRFATKEQVVAAAIARTLPEMHTDPRRTGTDARATLRRLVNEALPPDAERYVALIGGLMAEHRRHPELIRAFRETILLPRRALVRSVIEDAQRAGDIRADIDPVYAVDLIGGSFLARVFAGLDVGRRWREDFFALWWSAVRS